MLRLRPYATAIALVFLTTLLLLPVRERLSQANFSLFYLLTVLLLAIWQGIGPSLLATGLSFLCFNFFFIHPYYTLAVADPREILDLTIFLVIATVTGQLATRVRREAERAHRSQMFEEADKLKTALLRAVSHDLRTPITIIKTSVSNLLDLHQVLSEAERVEMLKTIENEADQLNKMVGNLLDMSRLQAGALQLNRQLNALEEVAGDVAARAWQLTKAERIKITFPDNMPLVPFDYGLILQALTNLVDNSLRYEPTGSLVEIRGNFHAQSVHIAVVNHGPTILPEDRNAIMEPFYHGLGGHVGLGLPIARGIIEAHQGRLWVEETPGGGATFIFSLPRDGESQNENSRRR